MIVRYNVQLSPGGAVMAFAQHAAASAKPSSLQSPPFVCPPMGVSQVGFTCRCGARHVNGRSLVLSVVE